MRSYEHTLGELDGSPSLMDPFLMEVPRMRNDLRI